MKVVSLVDKTVSKKDALDVVESLRKAIEDDEVRLLDLECAEEELAALKAQSTEPVAWEYRTYNPENDEVYFHVTQSWLEAKNYDQYPRPLFPFQPQATALVDKAQSTEQPVADYIIYWHGETPQLVGATEANIQHAQELGGRYELVYLHPPKQEITEPFGYWHQGETYEESEFFLASESGDVRCDDCVVLYTAPPTALVEDFKRRAVEVCRKLAEEEGHVGATDCEAAIESLPLIEGEK